MYIPSLYFGSGNYIPCDGLLAWYNWPTQQSGSDITYTTFTGNDAASSKNVFNYRHRFDNLITTQSSYADTSTGLELAPNLQLYVLDDINPINSVSGSDPDSPYLVSSSLDTPIIGCKNWFVASGSTYGGVDFQPFPIGKSVKRPFMPYFTQSAPFEAFPQDVNQQMDTTIVMTGKLNFNTDNIGGSREFQFLEYQYDDGVGEGPLAEAGWVAYGTWGVYPMTSSVDEFSNTLVADIQGAPDFDTLLSSSLTNNTNGIETFVWQIDSQGSIVSNAQTVLSLRASCLNNFRDVYYYTRGMDSSGQNRDMYNSIIGYNRSGTFGTGNTEPFEYQIAHQHYTRLLTPAEMNKVHTANISNNTDLQGCS